MAANWPARPSPTSSARSKPPTPPPPTTPVTGSPTSSPEPDASELFYVLTGSLRVLTGEDLVILNEGDFLVIPPNTPHAFEAAGTTDTEVLFVLTHAKPRFDYYRLLEGVYRGETDPAELAATSDLYDNHYVESPVWIGR
ncbi:cupin domain-containing protein [Kribbella qitaiheensis]|uniref:cupin domain-containing protein n=1 Tax=Kribbella qitaiheensis TaxID=1544730 RepID=UPI00361A587A